MFVTQVCIFVILVLKINWVTPDCSKRPAAPMNETWFKTSQPTDGWYFSMYNPANFEDQVETLSDTSKKTTKSGGSKRMCWAGTTTAADGASVPAGMTYRCTYDKIEEQYCTGTLVEIPIPGLPELPHFIRGVVLKTDNSTYAALGTCAFGTIESTMVISPNAAGPDEKSRDEIRAYLTKLGIKNTTAPTSKATENKGGRYKSTYNCGNGGSKGIGSLLGIDDKLPLQEKNNKDKDDKNNDD